MQLGLRRLKGLCAGLVTGVLVTTAGRARAACSANLNKPNCGDDSVHAQHPALCDISEHGAVAAAELLSRPASNDPEEACARSWALRQVYQLNRPHEQHCEQYLCPFSVEDSHLVPDAGTQRVTVTIAFDIQRVAINDDGTLTVVYIRAEGKSLAVRPIELSLAAGKYTLEYKNQSGATYEEPLEVQAQAVAKELGARIDVGTLSGKTLSIDGVAWSGGSILISDPHDVMMEGEAPGCRAQIDRTRATLTFPTGCGSDSKRGHGLSFGVQARVDRAMGAGGMLLLGPLLGIPLGRFVVEPRLGWLASGNAQGFSGGAGLGYRVLDSVELLLGADVLGAYIEDAPTSGVMWGVYPGLQARYRWDSTGLGLMLSGNVVYLFDEELKRQAKTVYPTLGLGAEWRFIR